MYSDLQWDNSTIINGNKDLIKKNYKNDNLTIVKTINRTISNKIIKIDRILMCKNRNCTRRAIIIETPGISISKVF